MDRKKIAICCVADNKVKYLSQALRLVQSLRWFGEDLKDADMFIGYFEPTPDYYLEEYQRFGATTVKLERYTSLHGPSNKMSLLKLDSLLDYEYVMLMDCDTIFARSISSYLNFSGVQSKIADLQTLPHELLCTVFEALGKQPPEIKYITSIDQKDTALYCNSGIIILSQDIFPQFIARWFEINDYLLQNLHLMGRLQFFCDQASFAAILSEYEYCYRELPLSMNFPAHFEPDRYPNYSLNIQPEIVHYHHMVCKSSGYLLDSSLPKLKNIIEAFNIHQKQDRCDNFCNAAFWDFRYSFYPELGSGISSRGNFGAYKAGIVRQFCHENSVEELLDYGFGDLSLFKQIESLKLKNYTGLDVSMFAVEQGKSVYPEYNFLELDVSEIVEEERNISSSYSICFDLLIYQKDRSAYEKIIKNILETTERGGLISGFDASPNYESEILFFHEPLSKSLSNFSNIEVNKIGSYRQRAIYSWQKTD